MRALPTALAMLGAISLVCGCGASHNSASPPATAPKPAPAVGTIPTSGTRIREAIRHARATNRSLFGKFPVTPGQQGCTIPLERALGGRPVRGICQTSVRPNYIAQAPAVTVVFTEKWDEAQAHCPVMAACRPKPRHYSWRVLEGVRMLKPNS